LINCPHVDLQAFLPESDDDFTLSPNLLDARGPFNEASKCPWSFLCLESVNLSNGRLVDDRTVYIISERCPRLSRLVLNHCTNITDQALGWLHNGPAIDGILFGRRQIKISRAFPLGRERNRYFQAVERVIEASFD
jgi:hypothetical protein